MKKQPEASGNIFQKFFERALGPKDTPKKKKKKPRNLTKDDMPVVKYNQKVAKFGENPNLGSIESGLAVLSQKILKINDSHFEANQMFQNKEDLDTAHLNYQDFKNMLSLDFEDKWQYKIVLEGGMLLCQMRDVHQERDNLAKYIKKYIKKEVRNRSDSLEKLEEMAENITPFKKDIHKNQDSEPNPLIQVLIDVLTKEIKRVKEAFQEAKEKVLESENENERIIKELGIKCKKLEVSEKYLQKQVEKLTELNLEADQKYYVLEQSKQELIKMQNHDYESMKKKNKNLSNEFNALQKYYESKVKECEDLEKYNQDWIEQNVQLEKEIKEKNQIIEDKDDEIYRISRNLKASNAEIKKLQAKNVRLNHNIGLASNKSIAVLHDNPNADFTLFQEIHKKLGLSEEQGDKESLNKIGVKICSYLALQDYNVITFLNKSFTGFLTNNTQMLRLTNQV